MSASRESPDRPDPAPREREAPAGAPDSPRAGGDETRPSAGRRITESWNIGTADAQTLRPSRDPMPERIGKYRILEFLGRGGMGSVLLAIRDDEQFRKRVAIKIIRKGHDTHDLLRRFELERQILSSMNHANIARVFDAGETAEGAPYFVMEHIEGEPIDEYCDRQGLPIRERIKLFRKVCSAVHYAHQHLVVHRDLKPTNILVSRDGEPKLLDFGIAKLLNPDLMAATVATGPELRLMTPEYASPEQARGKPISTTSDVYSLGVLLYELLSGHKPYRFETRAHDELVRVICDVEPQKPSTAIARTEEYPTRDGTRRSVTPDLVARQRAGAFEHVRRWLRGDLDNIVLKAMQKSPRLRYASAEQLAEDLERFLNNEPVLARPATWRYRVGKFTQRHRAVVGSVGAVLVILAGATVWTAAAWRAAARERDRAERLFKLSDELTNAYSRAERETRWEGGAELRARLYAEISPLLERFATEAQSNPALAAIRPEKLDQLADNHSRLGDYLGGGRSPNIGKPGEALEHYRRALDIRRRLVVEAGRNSDYELKLIGTMVGCAGQLARVGSRGEAERLATEAVEMARRLEKDNPASPDARRTLAIALLQQADLAEERDATAARQALIESVELRRRLCAEFPENSTFLRDLSAALAGLASHLKRDNAAADVLALRRESLDVAERILFRESRGGVGPRRFRRDAAIAQRELAEELLRAQLAAEGETLLRKSVATLRGLADDDPSDARGLLELTRAQIGLGEVLLNLPSRAQEAAPILSRAVELAEQARDANGASDESLYELGIAHALLAHALRAGGEHESAAAEARAAQALLDRLGPRSAYYRAEAERLRREFADW